MQRIPVQKLIVLWAAWAILTLGFQQLVTTRLELKRPDHVLGWTSSETTLSTLKENYYLVEPFLNEQVAMDSEYYLSIAVAGYDDPEVDYVTAPEPANQEQFTKNYAFYPLYPTLIKVFMLPLQPLGLAPVAAATLAGIIVALLGTLVGVLALYDLVYPLLGEEGAFRAVFYLLIFPTGFFLAQVYTEGLFIGLVFGSLALMQRGARDRRYYWAASLLAALAVLTRSVGAALVLALLVQVWLNAGKDNRWKALAWGLVYSSLPVGIYLAMSFSSWGEGFRFVQENFFGRSMLNLSGSIEGWTAALQIVLGGTQGIPGWVMGRQEMTRLYFTLEILAVLLGLLAILLTWKQLPHAAAFSLAAWGIAVTSGFPQSNIRYMLVLPVIFLLLGRWGRRPVFDRAWTITSLLLYGMLLTLFSFDFWVA